MIDFFNFFLERYPEIFQLLLQHLKISGIALSIAILVGIPVGIAITKNEVLAKLTMNIAGVFQTIPSLALFGLIIPFLGIGVKPAIFVLFLYSLLPIITNTYIGVKSVDKSTVQAAIGMGMTNFQVLTIVKLPIAISVIMSGIRISAVSNIGTTTIAALIGAGGLGDYIFRGISMNNNNLILCGAIPTALLAFSINYILVVFEKAVTPIGMLSNRNEKYKSKKIIKFIGIILLVLSAFGIYNKVNEKSYPTIVIGHKNFTEQRILGNLLSLIIENKTDFKTEVLELGGTNLVFQALKSGEIDVYPEYTGTAYAAFLGQKDIIDAKSAYNYIEENYKSVYDLGTLAPLGFENTYAFIVTKEFSEKYNITKISDLKKYKDKFLLASPAEFIDRQDGLEGVKKSYNINFEKVNMMDSGLVISSLINSKVDIGIAFSTDGLIAKYDFIILEDDLNFFPPYECFISFKNEFKDKNPEVVKSLEILTDNFSNRDMQELNLAALESGKDEKTIAREILVKKGLIDK